MSGGNGTCVQSDRLRGFALHCAKQNMRSVSPLASVNRVSINFVIRHAFAVIGGALRHLHFLSVNIELSPVNKWLVGAGGHRHRQFAGHSGIGRGRSDGDGWLIRSGVRAFVHDAVKSGRSVFRMRDDGNKGIIAGVKLKGVCALRAIIVVKQIPRDVSVRVGVQRIGFVNFVRFVAHAGPTDLDSLFGGRRNSGKLELSGCACGKPNP